MRLFNPILNIRYTHVVCVLCILSFICLTVFHQEAFILQKYNSIGYSFLSAFLKSFVGILMLYTAIRYHEIRHTQSEEIDYELLYALKKAIKVISVFFITLLCFQFAFHIYERWQAEQFYLLLDQPFLLLWMLAKLIFGVMVMAIFNCYLAFSDIIRESILLSDACIKEDICLRDYPQLAYFIPIGMGLIAVKYKKLVLQIVRLILSFGLWLLGLLFSKSARKISGKLILATLNIIIKEVKLIYQAPDTIDYYLTQHTPKKDSEDETQTIT